MNSKVIPSVLFVLLIVAGPAAADWFVTPYGSFSHFMQYPTHWTLELDTPQYTESISVSELDNAFGYGVALGYSSDEHGLVMGLNVEFINGDTDSTFTIKDSTGKDIRVGDRTIDASAMTVGGFVGAILPSLSKGNWQGVVGIEVGALMPQGDISLMYLKDVYDENGNHSVVQATETQSLEGTSLYLSFFFTEDYLFTDLIGLSATLGWRGVDTKLQAIDTDYMSGSYAQEYSGFFARFGLKVEF
jgi:hypothetical protein